MLSRIRSILQTDCLLDITKTVLVGVSGGADSLCLLDVLWLLNFPIIVAHYNHQLQPEADLAAEKVARIASKLNLKFVQDTGEINKFAEEGGFTLEEAARIMRYQFLFEEAERNEVQAVVVGHNADDQVETFLMHMLRGSGLKGLTGMSFRSLPSSWSEEIPLVRPLLGVWRDEILLYLEERNLNPVVDPSNQDMVFFRNRIRHQLVPSLEEYNPQVRRLIWNTVYVLQEDYAVLEDIILDAWQDCIIEKGIGYVGIDRHILKSKPIGIQRHILRRAMASSSADLRDIDFELTDRAINFLSTPPKSGKCELTKTIKLLLEGRYFWVFSKEASLPDSAWPQLYGNTMLVLKVPGELNLNDDWVVKADYMPYDHSLQAQVFSNENPFQVFIDANKIQFQVLVRNRQPGDRIKPLGMEGHSMKLAHFMINVKIPERARENWPLICDSEEILWVPGYRSSHYSRVSEDTKDVICINLKKRDRV